MSKDSLTSAYCGIDCTTCPVYQAAFINDLKVKQALQIEISKNWSEMTQREIRPEDINCHGCKSNELFVFCVECGFKRCNEKLNISNCKECNGFPCGTHTSFVAYQEQFGTKIRFL